MFIGIDVAKNKHDVCIYDSENEKFTAFTIPNTRKGFEKFWIRLREFKKEHVLEDVVIGFESTGPYAEPFFHYLRT